MRFLTVRPARNTDPKSKKGYFRNLGIERKKLWFLGLLPGMSDSNLFINAVISLSNFLIWECKLRKEIVPAGTVLENLLAGVKKCLYLSSTLRTVKTKLIFSCAGTSRILSDVMASEESRQGEELNSSMDTSTDDGGAEDAREAN
jgi:hypothetical protein